jgi:predicted GNAT family acetyltransferase
MTAGRRQHSPREADETLVSVQDDPLASRFELRVNGVLAGYVSYRDARSGRAFEHTVIATEYQGMGLASQLIRYALNEARATGRNVLPFCPFVRSFIQQHPAYLDLVGQPERFGITVHTPDSR